MALWEQARENIVGMHNHQSDIYEHIPAYLQDPPAVFRDFSNISRTQIFSLLIFFSDLLSSYLFSSCLLSCDFLSSALLRGELAWFVHKSEVSLLNFLWQTIPSHKLVNITAPRHQTFVAQYPSKTACRFFSNGPFLLCVLRRSCSSACRCPGVTPHSAQIWRWFSSCRLFL